MEGKYDRKILSYLDLREGQGLQRGQAGLALAEAVPRGLKAEVTGGTRGRPCTACITRRQGM